MKNLFLINYIKSLYYSFKFCGIMGFKLPIIVGYKTKIKAKSHSLVFVGKIQYGLLSIGVNPGSFFHCIYDGAYLNIKNGGKIEIYGKTLFSKKTSVNVEKNAILTFGRNFSANFNLVISCSNRISFGDDCIVGWNCQFFDGDGHRIYSSNDVRNEEGIIKIASNTWLCSNLLFLKNVFLMENTVVGANSFLNNFTTSESNVLIAGNPGKIVKRNIRWEK